VIPAAIEKIIKAIANISLNPPKKLKTNTTSKMAAINKSKCDVFIII